MGIRDELAQLRAVIRYDARWEVRLRRHEVARHLSLPRLRMRSRQAGEVWGVTMVRDEADIVGVTIAHLLEQGCDRLLVSDNLSTDDTPAILAELARRDPRILLASDSLDAYHQDHKMTLLARFASRAGADWIVPFDADELWFAEVGSVAEHLRTLGSETCTVGTVAAPSHDCIPTASLDQEWKDEPFLLNSTPATFGKIAVRAHRAVRIDFGNHGAARVGDTRDGLRIAHVPYRGPAQLARKVRRGQAVLGLASQNAGVGTHWRDLAALSDPEVASLWTSAQAGEPHPEVALNVGGPMVSCHPLHWHSWDPDRDLAIDAEEHR